MKRWQLEKILNTKIEHFDDLTVKEFFEACLWGLWDDESFSGKRPGVDSGWAYSIVAEMIKLDPSLGILDKDGFVDECDSKRVDTIYKQLIKVALNLKV